jgi:alpha/beta superfamily hydrolase
MTPGAGRIDGPAGALECLLELPVAATPASAAVVCHPHPLHGGNMHNKVAHVLARVLRDEGAVTLRFNFRGVGASTGSYDEGAGETQDALAAVASLRRAWPGLPLVLAGFSCGGAVAPRAAPQAAPDWLVAVAPAVDRVPGGAAPLPACPQLFVHGADDDVVLPDTVRAYIASHAPGAQFALLPGVGHFFHGRLHQLGDTLRGHWPAGVPRRAR